MRKRVHEFFTPQRDGEVAPVRPRRRSRELLDEAAPDGEMDVLRHLAAPLPVRIITEMMGVPDEDREHLRELADKLLYINRGEPYRMRP